MTDLAAGLAAYLGAQLGTDVRVTELRRLAGGASRETWLFTMTTPDGATERLVLRRDPPGHVIETSRRREFLLLRAAAAAGVAVPRVRWCEEDTAVLGAPFFVMDYVEGETLARRLLRDAEYASARAALPEQLATALARVHAIKLGVAPLDFLARPAADTGAAVELGRYESLFRALAPEPHPAFELALRWLAVRMPATSRRTLVHGDYRVGNVIFGPEGLRAVIDWEMVHVGDPLEDLGWLCVRAWRFGADANPVGGLCDRAAFVSIYERAAGVRVDPTAVRWWEVFGNLKWGIICIMQMQTFLAGVKSVELASLGRRTAETELELLDLTEGA